MSEVSGKADIKNPRIILVSVYGHKWSVMEPEKFMDYTFEPPVQVFAWVIELCPLAVIILIGLWKVWKVYRAGHSVAFFRPGPMLKPKDTWGPRHDATMTSNQGEDDLKSVGIKRGNQEITEVGMTPLGHPCWNIHEKGRI